MACILFSVPSSKRGELDAALKDDVLSRQSQKLREAAALGGPSDRIYVLLEGSADAVHRAEELVGAVGPRLAPEEADPIYRKFKDEEEAASAGMGLFFTEE